MSRQHSFGLQKLGATIALLLCSASVSMPVRAVADDFDNLFKEEAAEPAATPVPTPAPTSTPTTASEKSQPSVQVKNVSDLGKLEAFEDVAVIQRRFLPRTQRFEFFIGPTLVLNDAFFLNIGGNARFAYHFSERYGLEAVGTYLSTNERQVTTDLREKRAVRTRSFVTPQTYMGLDFKWSPVYGKMTWMNRKITPFDQYFSLGIGMTGTNQSTSEATLHIGTGQIFAQSKGIAWRWDFSWHAFQATSSLEPKASASLYHNLLLTFGASFYFPEASYR